MTGRLNEEQQKMVEENHDLIYRFMHKYHLSENDITDWYGELAIALCEAALSYTDKCGVEFYKYAVVYMNRSFKKKNVAANIKDSYLEKHTDY